MKGSKFHGTITVTGGVAGGGSLTLAVKPQIVVFGGKATTSGALSNHKAGENAEIFAQPCGQPSATKLATVTTTTGGRVQRAGSAAEEHDLHGQGQELDQ